MKRWNGWGNIQTEYPLPDSAKAYLHKLFRESETWTDATYDSVLRSIPPSRLPEHPLIDRSSEARLEHARGQSLPDWIALRSGNIPVFPDGVAFPVDEAQTRTLLDFSRKNGFRVIPYGGGTSVVGHINPLRSDEPVLTISMERMTKLLELDEEGLMAVFEAGVTGPDLESNLGNRGYTLGHFPQSHEYSTLGGWIASRSSGQQSYYYGRIEQLFAGGHMETPYGHLDMPHFPASAAGPDVREMVLGSEGRMGIITRARVRITPLPEREEFHGVFFPSWEQGVEAVRRIAQDRLPVSMLRLSNPQETLTTLILSGKPWVNGVDRGLTFFGYGSQRCLLIFGLTGRASLVHRTRHQVASLCREYAGLVIGRVAGRSWEKARFYAPYLRNTLWDSGVVIDTLETAIPWKKVIQASKDIPAAITTAMDEFNDNVLAFTHLSHIYRDAASIYTTFLFRRLRDAQAVLGRWQAMKAAASRVIQQHGGTISHQHGVGTDHASYLPAEKGELGIKAIRAACHSFDPDGMMNPGKLFVD